MNVTHWNKTVVPSPFYGIQAQLLDYLVRQGSCLWFWWISFLQFLYPHVDSHPLPENHLLLISEEKCKCIFRWYLGTSWTAHLVKCGTWLNLLDIHSPVLSVLSPLVSIWDLGLLWKGFSFQPRLADPSGAALPSSWGWWAPASVDFQFCLMVGCL